MPINNTEKQTIIQQLETYDLSSMQATVYLSLLEKNTVRSVVQIARDLEVGRTKIYNALDVLESKGLVKRVFSEVGFDYSAAPPEELETYWQKKQSELAQLTPGLETLVESLRQFSSPGEYASQVKYYSGQRGMEQITYNSLKAKNDLYIYELATNMSVFTGQKTAENYRQILAQRHITTHQLTNYRDIDDYTRVSEMIKRFWDIRWIDPKILKIEFEMVIYNDVVAMYSYVDNDSFGIEIYNQNLASMQIQIFKAMQNLAIPMKKRGWFGKASL